MLRSRLNFLRGSGLLLLLASCSSPEAPGLADTSAFARARPAASASDASAASVSTRAASRSVRALGTSNQPSVAELFNWAESAYAEVFPTSNGRPPDQTYQGSVPPYSGTFQYRYYAQTDIVLAVNGDEVLALVSLSFNPTLIPLGKISDYTCHVFPSRCNTTETPVVFDAVTVASAGSEVAAFMNVCSPAKSGAASALRPSRPLWTERVLALARSSAMTRASRRALGYTATQPADKLGECGGRMSYQGYSHVGGVTSATRTFTDYCSQDSDTGERQVINGSMSFVNTGIPTEDGPVTSRLVADSPQGLRYVTRSAGGAVLTDQTFAFRNYVYTPGVPGGDATASHPDRLQADEIVSTNNLTGKAYRQTSYAMTSFELGDGGEQITISGRGYRSNGQYFETSTPTPLRTDSKGDFVSGVFSFGGANGSTTLATVVPGSELQTTLSIDGQPVSGMPACK